MSHEQMAAIAAVYAKHFLAQTGGQVKKKIKECAIGLNHNKEGEDAGEGGDCSLSLSNLLYVNSHFPSSLWSWQTWSYQDSSDLKLNYFYKKWSMKTIIKKHDVWSTSHISFSPQKASECQNWL